MMKGTDMDNHQAINMTIQTEITDALIDSIADRVFQKMLPLMESWHEPDQYLNVAEVALMLGKSKAQIYQWVNRASHGLSEFPYQKAGRSLRFSKRAIQEWMKKH